MAPSSFELILFGFILLLPFLYETSRTFRYYFKFILYYGIVTILAIVFIPIFLLRPKNIKNLVLASYPCSYINILLGLRWELRGKEHLNQDVACIIVANHQSSLDLLGMFDIWPIMDRCTAIAKKEIFYFWPFGFAAWLCGLIFIDRLNSDKARSVINTASEQSKDKQFKLWIFPEGTRRNTGEIHPFKKGAFYAAINAQLPILPVVFSSYYFLSNKEKRFDSGRIVITTLPLIPTKGLNKDDVELLMEKTRNVMTEAFHATSTEVQLALPSAKPYVE
ncbi:PREDICTED: 1-acyl-sn-glycerol-3-phosphate acyltransferase alpha [Polistes dominula]|uniref:1-acyl-sn-glycerol-3-phosphate acyltransferase n=1 Tax=Polistes dominula TaxID=743375 RepID=A0ABM1IMD9_POLDO|nr:PREDICTED: 1-acyl-sn-glycerol-3-phosphate acyltransferase alpha [Polistes dominula]